MADAAELRISDLKDKYAKLASSRAFDRLYDDDPDFGHMFSVLHQRLNEHFLSINDRALTTHHYWAENSREFLDLIRQLDEDLYDLKRAGVEARLAEGYEEALERCKPWLSRSGGSTVPADFTQIEVVKHEPVFSRPSTTTKLAKQSVTPKLDMVGEGSYAHVFSYVDPDYDIKFAVKRAKKNIDPRDLHRFKREFDVMKRLSFPYVVEVYRYDEERNEYRMEFCDETLRSYIKKRNASLTFAYRKRIVLQFLYGLNYIHREGLLHRDISLQNVLLKVYASSAVIVKLSDFGLVKEQESNYTRTHTELRGTIRDPLLENFRDYSIANEIYATGWVLSFVFTGRESLSVTSEEVGRIVRKCVDHDLAQRYASVREIISDVEALVATPSDASA
ncbi:protein kinase family protein [Modestobacter sp. SYSU DS0290]